MARQGRPKAPRELPLRTFVTWTAIYYCCLCPTLGRPTLPLLWPSKEPFRLGKLNQEKVLILFATLFFPSGQ